MSDELQQTETTQEQATVQLQISDLLLAAQVIQLASNRGAFKPEEFTQVGGLYERVVAFLQSSGALTPSTPADESATEATAPDAE